MSLVGVEEDKNSIVLSALSPACASEEFLGLQHKSPWLHLFAQSNFRGLLSSTDASLF